MLVPQGGMRAPLAALETLHMEYLGQWARINLVGDLEANPQANGEPSSGFVADFSGGKPNSLTIRHLCNGSERSRRIFSGRDWPRPATRANLLSTEVGIAASHAAALSLPGGTWQREGQVLFQPGAKSV
jgi:hypothetical protein